VIDRLIEWGSTDCARKTLRGSCVVVVVLLILSFIFNKDIMNWFAYGSLLVMVILGSVVQTVPKEKK
jgi:hypothetical protein